MFRKEPLRALRELSQLRTLFEIARCADAAARLTAAAGGLAEAAAGETSTGQEAVTGRRYEARQIQRPFLLESCGPPQRCICMIWSIGIML